MVKGPVSDVLRFIFRKEYIHQINAMPTEELNLIFLNPFSTSICKYEENFIYKMCNAYQEVLKLNKIDFLKQMNVNNLSDISKYDKKIYEKLSNDRYESLEDYCNDVEINTIDIEYNFFIKLIHFEFWKMLDEKIKFLQILSMKLTSGKMTILVLLFIMTILHKRFMVMHMMFVTKNLDNNNQILKFVYTHITANDLI